MKTCIRCGVEKPATTEFFPRHKKMKSGLTGHCRRCHRIGANKSKQAHRARLTEARRAAYAADGGMRHRSLEGRRRERDPIAARASILRNGVRVRSSERQLVVDAECLTADHWYRRLSASPNCPCCGIEFALSFEGRKRYRDNSPTVDRIDNSKGYTVLNTAVICWRCNNIKRNYSSRDLRIVADWIDAVAGKSEETQKDVVIKG